MSDDADIEEVKLDLSLSVEYQLNTPLGEDSLFWTGFDDYISQPQFSFL